MILLKNLAFRNLKAYSSRTVFLITFAFLMAFSIFTGTIVVQGIKHGLNLVEKRLGADILVVPESSKKDFDAQTVLIQADPGYFYMPYENYSKILKIDGIEKASPQLFLASASAGCCSAKLQLVGFEPESDFTIQPWIRDSSNKAILERGDIFVGNNITIDENGYIRLYGNDCKIKGKFSATGSNLDNAVYMNFDTVKNLIRSSFEKSLNQYGVFNVDEVVSSVLVKVQKDTDIEEVANKIRSELVDVNVITSKSMVSGISENLQKVSKSANNFIILFWLISFFMTLLIFMMMINDRKREFASLKSMGANMKILSGIVIKEAFCVNLIGGILALLIGLGIFTAYRRAFTLLFGAGFVLPSPIMILLLALLALISVLGTSLLSASLAIYKINKMDTSFILKEGE